MEFYKITKREQLIEIINSYGVEYFNDIHEAVGVIPCILVAANTSLDCMEEFEFRTIIESDFKKNGGTQW